VPKHLPRRSIHHRNGNSRTIIRRGHNTMRPYPVRARIICKSPQNASRGNACLQNESPQNAHTLQSKRRCFSASPFS